MRRAFWKSWPSYRKLLSLYSNDPQLTPIFSASERKRRQVYRGEVHGQLPFEAKGLDDPVPTLDFTTALGSDVAYSLEREDVDGEI